MFGNGSGEGADIAGHNHIGRDMLKGSVVGAGIDKLDKARVEKLIKNGLMTEYGLKKVKIAKQLGNWDNPINKPRLTFDIPKEFALELRKNKKAQKTFKNLGPTYQKQYLGWIEVAKMPETKLKRIKESIQLLAAGKKIGLK